MSGVSSVKYLAPLPSFQKKGEIKRNSPKKTDFRTKEMRHVICGGFEWHAAVGAPLALMGPLARGREVLEVLLLRAPVVEDENLEPHKDVVKISLVVKYDENNKRAGFGTIEYDKPNRVQAQNNRARHLSTY